MELIGMLDSPYVRRVAITFNLLGIDFKHRSVSVFRDYDTFRSISPVVKAPSLVCDNGVVLTDSNLIIDYGVAISSSNRCMIPNETAFRQKVLERIGIALVVCEKSIQIVYEQNLRPAEKRHQPWVNRVTEQLLTALRSLESLFDEQSLKITQDTIDLAEVTAAVAWRFTQEMLPGVVTTNDFPLLNTLSQKAEQLPPFKAAPYGDQTYPVSD